MIGAIVGAVPAFGFTIGDIVSFADGTPFDLGWAITETVWASLLLLGGVAALGAVVYSGATCQSYDCSVDGGALVGSLLPLMIGGLNLGHALWSMENLGAASPATARWAPWFSPSADGVMAGVGGAF